jgi:ABC-2 type transport system permease protein
VLPQLLVCGLFVPRDQMAPALEGLSYALPMTYAYDTLDRVTVDGSLGTGGAVSVAVTLGATVLGLVLAAGTLRRRTP